MGAFNILLNTIANFVNNTFVGTFLAGACLALLGLRLYRKHKMLDIAFAKRTKTHELATALLTHVNVAVNDYKGQINVYDGENAVAKAVFDKINQLNPNFYIKETLDRFNGYTKTITHDFNELSTPLALDSANEAGANILTNSIPQMTFLLSMTSTLSSLDTRTLREVSEMMTKHSDDVRGVLEKIINTED